MAQLAHCPACKSEVAIPERDASSSDHEPRWGQCPACEEVFELSEAAVRPVMEIKLVPPPDDASNDEATEGGDAQLDWSPEQRTPASFSGRATLSSFLSEAAPPEEANQDADERGVDDPNEAPPPSTPPTLADFQGFNELFRSNLGEETGTPEPPEATVTDQPVDVPDERNALPAEDRLRPTLGQWHHGDISGEGEVAEGFDEMESADEAAAAHAAEAETPTVSDFSSNDLLDHAASDPSKLNDDLPAWSVDDAPSFDFEVGAPTDDLQEDVGETKSLREAMGFGAAAAFEPSEPLEVDGDTAGPDFSSLSDDEPEGTLGSEVDVAVTGIPQGTVPARRRSGAGSVVKTMVGVAGGGVVGIAAGYLLLLWIFHFLDRPNEPLGLAQFYPDVIKPEAFRSSASTSTGPVQVAEQGSPESTAQKPEEPGGEAGGGAAEPNPIETANFETEITDSGSENASGFAEAEPLPWDLGPQPASDVAVSDAPAYTAAELQEVTTAGERSTEGMLEGEFSDKAYQKPKGASYATLAKLADALTFAEGPHDASWKRAAREVFPPLFKAEQHRQEISLIASYWLESDKRRHGGIFFCGTPDDGRQQGDVAEYRFVLPIGVEMVVLTPQPLPDSVTSAASVAVVGSVLENPAKQIEGYTGSATQAVWSTNLFPIEGD